MLQLRWGAGVKVAFVSALGNDDLAKQMLDLLKGGLPAGGHHNALRAPVRA